MSTAFTPRLTIEEPVAQCAGPNAELVDGAVRIPGVQAPFERPATAPLLVFLAVSREGRWLDVFQAMAEHLRAGARAVVVLDLRHATACVYRDDEPPKVLREADTLTIPDVLPGFSLPVARLFS